jgi:hypothetical protein
MKVPVRRGVGGGCAHGIPGQARRTAAGTAAAQHRPALAEIDRLLADGRARIGRLLEREFLIAGVAPYAGEESKRDGALCFANSDARMIIFYCCWRRRFFEIDESRLRVRLYLHEVATWRRRSPTGRR